MMNALERIKVVCFRQTAKKTIQRKGGLRDTSTTLRQTTAQSKYGKNNSGLDKPLCTIAPEDSNETKSSCPVKCTGVNIRRS